MTFFSSSLCRHGPRCRRHADEECCFAHSYEEICYPRNLYQPDLWLDKSHLCKGRSAPDIFVGQEYSCAQKCRVLGYLKVANPPYPAWVNLYLWFLQHPRHIPDRNLDLGWSESLKELGIINQDTKNLQLETFESEVLYSWNRSWKFGVDPLGVSFIDRMKRRLKDAKKYKIATAICSFTEATKYNEATSMHWGEHSRSYLNMKYGDKFVLLHTTIGNYAGWAWVVKYPQIRSYGWVPFNHLLITEESIYLEYVDMSTALPELLETSTAARLQTPRPKELIQLCQITDDLSVLGETAVCVSDGSADEGEGCGAATWCNFPIEESNWIKTAITAKMFTQGATASEIIGVILSLHTLKQHLDSFKIALVHTDSDACVRYFDEYTDPTDDSGWKLYPLIMLARDQLLYLYNMKKSVVIKKIPRTNNLAHESAKNAMLYGKNKGWPLVTFDVDVQAIPLLWSSIRHVDDYAMRVARGEYIPRMITF